MSDDQARKTGEELAHEAADCIELNDLRGEELFTYLAAWIADCAVSGDLDAIKAGRALAAARHSKALGEPAATVRTDYEKG